MRLTKQEQDQVVASVRNKVESKIPEDKHDKICIYYAMELMDALIAKGVPAQLQAGTAYYKSIRDEEDDGVTNNYYGYEFRWNNETHGLITQGKLPEMHVWVAVAKKPYELIDLTSRYFKSRCIAHNQKWTMPDPPDYLWVNDLPKDIIYYPDLQATEIAYALIRYMTRPNSDLTFRILKDYDEKSFPFSKEGTQLS